MKVLNKQEAEELAIKRLSKNATAERQFHILSERTVEKPFGWIFFYEVISVKQNSTLESSQTIRPVITNKYSQQVIGNSIDQPVDSIVKLYEDLLAKRKAIAEGWCLTFDPSVRQISPLQNWLKKQKKLDSMKSPKKHETITPKITNNPRREGRENRAHSRAVIGYSS